MPTPDQIADIMMAFTAQQMNAARDAVVNPANRDKLAQMIANATAPSVVEPEPPVVQPPPTTLPPREVIHVTDQHGLVIGGHEPADEIVIENKELICAGSLPGERNGIRLTKPAKRYVLRNLIVRGFTVDLNATIMDGRTAELVMEDCAFLDATGHTHAQGYYLSGVDLTLMRRVVTDSNGTPTIFSHNAYHDNESGHVVADDCLWSRCKGSHGAQFRAGANLIDCAFLDNPIALNIGGGDANAGGVEAYMRRSVIRGGGDISPLPEHARGWGLHLENIAYGTIEGNVLADGAGGNQIPIIIGANKGVGVLDVTIDNNVRRNRSGPVHFDPGPTTGTTIVGFEELPDSDPRRNVDLSPETFRADWWAAVRELRCNPGDYARWACGRMGL